MLKMMALCLLVLGADAAHAREVWKCKVGDEIRYSDQPCETQGQALAPRVLQGNVVEGSRAPMPTGDAGSGRAAAPRLPGAEQNVCPSDRDITSMETRSSSISLSREAKSFMQDEIRRARQCRKGQGRYSAADWDVSRAAQDAQSSLSGAADARRRAEAMHSAADPLEGDRIARQREAEAAAEREAEREAERRAQLRKDRAN